LSSKPNGAKDLTLLLLPTARTAHLDHLLLTLLTDLLAPRALLDPRDLLALCTHLALLDLTLLMDLLVPKDLKARTLLTDLPAPTAQLALRDL